MLIGDQDTEWALAWAIVQFHDVLSAFCTDLHMHRLTAYVRNIADAFSYYKRDVRILDDPRRLQLCFMARHAMQAMMNLLAVPIA